MLVKLLKRKIRAMSRVTEAEDALSVRQVELRAVVKQLHDYIAEEEQRLRDQTSPPARPLPLDKPQD
jgi:hypothetical protein